MWTCVVCRFDVTLDDAIAPTTGRKCVCLRCFQREIGMPTPPLSDWYRGTFDQLTAAKLDAM